VVKQTDDYQDYEAILQEQQNMFKEYMQAYFNSDASYSKRFQFLKTADYKLKRINLMYADAVMEKNANLYRYWSMMIDDTRRFISIGLDTLKFQAKCPPHMLAEPSNTLSLYNWTAHRADLMEIIVGLYHADVIRLNDGNRPEFADFANEVGKLFGVAYKRPSDEMRKIIHRKRNKSPFLNRLISGIIGKFDESNK